MWNLETEAYKTTCSICYAAISARKEDLWVRGSPVNTGMGYHLDGFPASRTTNKSAVVIDAVPLTDCKLLQANLSEKWVWPVCFPPKEQIQAGPNCYDPFMLLLVLKAIRLLEERVVVPYALASSEVSPLLPQRPPRFAVRVRVLPLSLFANLPALAEMAKFKRGGKHCSQRCGYLACKCDGKLVYADAQKIAREGCQEKILGDVMDAAWQHLRAGSKADRDAISNETGCLGFPLPMLLWGVCGFNLIKDVARDFMHKGPKNQVKHFQKDTLKGKVQKVDGKNVPVPPLANVALFGKQLQSIKPTRKLADGRWPKDPAVRPLGYMKAEEH
jgi:hypothetical protein